MNLSLTDIIACLALLASIAAAWTTWRIHKDSAGRVRVHLNAVAYRPHSSRGGLQHTESGKFHLDPTADACVELCQVVIENPGRTGITVTDVRLRFEGLDEKYAVMPRPLALNSTFQGHSTIQDTCFRLEAYDRKTLLLDYWALVDEIFEAYPSVPEVSVFAEVVVAGHDHPFSSKKHGYWRIKRHTVSAFSGYDTRRPRNVILTALMRMYFQDLSQLDGLGAYAVTAEEILDLSKDFPAIHERLDMAKVHPKSHLTEHDQQFQTGHIAMAVWDQRHILKPFSVPSVVQAAHQEWIQHRKRTQEAKEA